MSEKFNVIASVHKPLGTGFRVKAEIKSIGEYINGMVVYPPNNEHNDWVVYTPTVAKARIVEFNKKSELWAQVRDACIDASKLYILENGQGNQYDDIVTDQVSNMDDECFTPEGVNKAIDELPFD